MKRRCVVKDCKSVYNGSGWIPYLSKEKFFREFVFLARGRSFLVESYLRFIRSSEALSLKVADGSFKGLDFGI